MDTKMMRNESPGLKSQEMWNREKVYLTSGLSLPTHELPIAFVRGDNDVLWDADGAQYIDWSAGTLTVTTGHCNEHVKSEIKSQLDQIWNTHDYPTPVRFEAIERLLEFMPWEDYVFQFYSAGSESIENALRAALGHTNIRRRRIASFREGYHGKTRASIMAVHSIYGSMIQPNYLAPASIPFPMCYRCHYGKEKESCNLHCAYEAKRILEEDKTIGIFIFEPILGTSGLYGPPEGYWDILLDTCKKLGIILIADEVTTGAGRTGKFLACEHFNIQPDIVVFGKGIASGFPAMVMSGKRDILYSSYVPSSIELRKQKLIPGQDFKAPDGASTTFGGNPLALSAIKGTLDEYKRLKLPERAQYMGRLLTDGLHAIAERNSIIGDIRGKGMLIGVELVKDRGTKEPAAEFAISLRQECARHGLLIHTSRTDKGIIHITPPLTLTEENAEKGLEIFEYSINYLQNK